MGAQMAVYGRRRRCDETSSICFVKMFKLLLVCDVLGQWCAIFGEHIRACVKEQG